MKKIYNIFLLALLPLVLRAQSLTYEQYMKTVADKNVGYLAEQYNVDIATAGLSAAKVFNDPELSVGYGNNQDWYKEMGQSVEVELSYDLDLSGVRRSRIRSARTEKQISEAAVVAYLSNLRFEATQAWCEAWRLREGCTILSETVSDMKKIALSDSIRLSVGDIGSTDATQSKIEAETLEGELFALETEYKNALLQLSYLCGGDPVVGITDESLPEVHKLFSESNILAIAESNRADLKAAELSHMLSENNLRLVKASRGFEMSLTMGYSYNSEVRNEIAPAPKYNGLSVGVAIPLKFSSFNRGERRAAQYQVSQSQKYYEDALLQVRKEATQALNAYLATQKVLQKYDSNLLKDARTIFDSRKIGYERGETSLIELISAQETFREVMQTYIDACANNYVSYAQLLCALGL